MTTVDGSQSYQDTMILMEIGASVKHAAAFPSIPTIMPVSTSDLGGQTLFYEVYRAQAGYWRWRLLAGNHRKIANSGEGYHNRNDVYAAIELVKRSGNAPVREISRAY